ncbi:large ribosomal subunit protein P2 [Cherax quadricarinatus]|uniref:large ribosomal subunit protein P2 n=1 Tax=Cherax quadricarinatus TaxID=27406 RepID=UPI00387EAA87
MRVSVCMVSCDWLLEAVMLSFSSCCSSQHSWLSGHTLLQYTLFKMRHVAAYLLAAMGTNQPTANTIKSILESVGVEPDDKQLAVLMKKMEGKNLNQLIAAGSALISSMPSCGGGGGSGGSLGAAAAAPAAAPAAQEKKKEEKKEEPQEESDDDMGFGLFD